jgi:hypothetical protein
VGSWPGVQKGSNGLSGQQVRRARSLVGNEASGQLARCAKRPLYNGPSRQQARRPGQLARCKPGALQSKLSTGQVGSTSSLTDIWGEASRPYIYLLKLRCRHPHSDDDGDAVGPVHQPRRLLHPHVPRVQQVHDQVLRQERTHCKKRNYVHFLGWVETNQSNIRKPPYLTSVSRLSA